MRVCLFAVACLFFVCQAQADDAPVITAFSPASGQVGDTVSITVNNLSQPFTVTFGGGVAATNYLSTQFAVVTVPAGAQSGPLMVTTSGGTATSATSFTVIPPGPGITLSVPVPKVKEGSGTYGEFLVTLDAPASTDLIVNYDVSGTATNGQDFQFLKGTAKVKAGKTSKAIKIVPQGDLGGAHKKVVVLELLAGDGYVTGAASPGQVKIVAQ